MGTNPFRHFSSVRPWRRAGSCGLVLAVFLATALMAAPSRGGDFVITVLMAEGQAPAPGVEVHAFEYESEREIPVPRSVIPFVERDAAGAPLPGDTPMVRLTDAQGQAVFSCPWMGEPIDMWTAFDEEDLYEGDAEIIMENLKGQMAYFLVTWRGQPFWTDLLQVGESAIITLPPDTVVTVTDGNIPLAGVEIMAVNSFGHPMPWLEPLVSGADGAAVFALEEDDFDWGVRFAVLAGQTTLYSGAIDGPQAVHLDVAESVLAPGNGPEAVGHAPEVWGNQSTRGEIRVRFHDGGNGLKADTMRMWIGNAEVEPYFREVADEEAPGGRAGEARYHPVPALVNGTYTVTASIEDFAGVETQYSFGFAVDADYPELIMVSPSDGEAAGDRRPVFLATFADEFSGMNDEAFRVLLDNVDITQEVSSNNMGLSYIPPDDMAVGWHHFGVGVADMAGNRVFERVYFEIAGHPQFDDPPFSQSFAFNNDARDRMVEMFGQGFHPDMTVMLGDVAAPVTVGGENRYFMHIPAGLPAGSLDVTVNARGMAAVLPGAFDSLPPFTLALGNFTEDDERLVASDPVLTGMAGGASPPYAAWAEITQDEQSRTVPLHPGETTSGVLSAELPLFSGMNRVDITVRDKVGNRTIARGWYDKDDVPPAAIAAEGRGRLQAHPQPESVRLTWGKSASRDTAHYEIWIDGGGGAVPSGTARGEGDFLDYTISGLTAETEYTAQVRPVDHAGNQGAFTQAAFRTAQN